MLLGALLGALVAVRRRAFEFQRFDSGEHLHRIPLGPAHDAQAITLNARAAAMRQAFIDRDVGRSRNEGLYPYDPWTADLG